MAKKVYLAGASAEIEHVLEVAAKLRAAGFEITEPWWERVHEARSLGFAHDAEVPDEYMAESARRNEDGLLASDFCVFLMRREPSGRRGTPGGPSGGAGYELGWIKGLIRGTFLGESPRRLYVVGEHARFIGIWTAPAPILGLTIEQIIARELAS